MDVGSARGKFILTGLDTAVKELEKFRKDLKASNVDYLHHRKEQAKVIKQYASQSEVIKHAVGRQKTYASAIRATSLALVNLRRRQEAVAAHIRKRIPIATKPSVDQYFDRSAGAKAASEYLQMKAAAKEAARPMVRLSVAAHKVGASIKNMTGKVRQGYSAFRKFIGAEKQAGSRLSDWWHRFGLVAVGFSVAYRAINAVELAIRQITLAFVGGLKALDNYKQSLATVSGMLSLLSTGGGGFSKRFNFFHKQMQGTMRESMRLAPMFRLSMNDISNAYKELAQFGVYATQDTTKKTLTAIAAIKEIAETTKSSSRQIRQEIQGVFNGQARVSDQFGRFLKRFPELKEKLYGINKLTTDNATKWKLAINTIADYYSVIIESNKTITSQLQISKNTLNIISMRALEMSGIWKYWLKRFTTFNDRLIDAKGNLGDLGKVFLQAFSDGWYILTKIINISFVIGNRWKYIATYASKAVKPFKDVAIALGKGFISLKLLGIAVSGFTGAGKFLLKELTSPITLFVVSLDVAKNLLFEFTNIEDTQFAKKLTSWSWWFDKIAKTISSINTGWKTLLAISAHPMLFLDTVNKKLAQAQLNEKGLHPELGVEIFEKELTDKLRHGLSNSEHNTIMQLWKKYYEGEKSRDFLYRMVSGGLTPEESQRELSERLKNVGQRTVEDFKSLFNKILKQITGLSDKDTKFLFPNIDPKKFKQEAANISQALNNITFNSDKAVEKIKIKSVKAYKMIGDKFGEYVKDSMTGDVKDLKDVFTNFLKFIRDAFAQTFADIANNMMRQFIYSRIGNTTMSGLFSNFFGGGGGGAAYSGPTPSGATLGSGAWGTPTTIAMASGGIISEPVFGIGKSGKSYSFGENGPERVLSNKDSFASPNVTVNVINKSSQPVDAKIGDTKKMLRGMVTDIILEDRRRGGIISRG